jgi:Uncharacterised protein conserved in bacteria (DUF2336)
MSAPPRLLHLLELADKGPALRAALAEEVAELLIDWPPDCPEEMRAPCEALLAQAAREVDSYTRARLRVRLYADPQLAARLLPRETNRDLMEWVRSGDIQGALADTAGLSPAKVAEILADDSGQALAVACKGSGIDRATYSAIAMLANGAGEVANAYEKLDMFDNVPTREAVRQLRAWRLETIRDAQ